MRPHWLRDIGATSGATTGGGAMIAHSLNGPYHTGTLDASQAPWAVATTRTLTAGSGLTGGGDLSADRSFTVGAGYGITVNADDVALASSTAGAGLTYTTGVLAVGAGAGITVNVDDVALTTPGTLTVSSTNTAAGSHTHAITASSDVGTSPAAALLKSTGGGGLTLASATTNHAVSLATFASGFAGSGWRADYGITTASRASMETDDLTVRGRLRVYELLIQQITRHEWQRVCVERIQGCHGHRFDESVMDRQRLTAHIQRRKCHTDIFAVHHHDGGGRRHKPGTLSRLSVRRHHSRPAGAMGWSSLRRRHSE